MAGIKYTASFLLIVMWCTQAFSQQRSLQQLDARQLNLLKQWIGNSRVVLLGEPTHGEGTIFEVKTEIVEYLHKEMGFDVIAFESGLYDMYTANEAIGNGKDVTLALQNSILPVWMGSNQFRPLVNYISENKDRLEVAGFDCQLTGTYTEEFVAELYDFISTKAKDGNRINAIEEKMMEDVNTSMSETFRFPENCKIQDFENACSKLIRSLNGITDQNEKAKSKRLFRIQHLRNLSALAHDYSFHKTGEKTESEFKPEDNNVRDSLMAENLLFLLKRYPEKKIICWGANTHFIKSSTVLKDPRLAAFTSMGTVLKKKLEGQLYVIGTTALSGKYGSWSSGTEPENIDSSPPTSIEQRLLAGNNIKVALTDLTNEKDVFCNALEYESIQGKWSSVFDALLVIRETQPSLPLNGSREYSRESEPSKIALPADTITVINPGYVLQGRVINTRNHQPVPYASILFKGTDMGTVTNPEGFYEVRLPENPAQSNDLIVTALGFGERKLSVPAGQKKLNIELAPQSETKLGEVTVLAKKLNAAELVRSALNHIPDNYITKDFNAEFYTRTLLKNRDSILLDEERAGLLFMPEGYSGNDVNLLKTQHRKINKAYTEDTTLGSGILLLSYTPFNSKDFLKTNPLLKPGNIKHYEFKLDSILPAQSGEVYVIGFSSKRKTHSKTGYFYSKSFSGRLYINATDEAIVRVDAFWEQDTAMLNQHSRQYFETSGKTLGKPNRYVWNIHNNYHTTSQTVLYEKSTDGKYGMSYALAQWQEQGINKLDNKPVQINAREVIVVRKITSVPITPILKPEISFSAARLNDSLFWNDYNRPLIENEQ